MSPLSQGVDSETQENLDLFFGAANVAEQIDWDRDAKHEAQRQQLAWG